MKAIVFGSTGLVGDILVNKIIKNYEQVICPVRKQLVAKHDNQVIVNIDFNDLPKAENLFQVHDLFYCLGTTLKKSGSIKKFIDTEMGLAKNILTTAKKNGVKRIFLISSQGANSRSPFPYLKTKGEIEKLLESLHFESIVILRPSLLIGDREEQRVFENLFQLITKPLIEPLQNYIPQFSPILATQVADALYHLSQKKLDKVSILENAEIIENSLN